MDQGPRPPLALGIATALLWGPHYFVVRGLAQAGVPGLALQFHLLLWPALFSWALLLLSGRASELGIFQRRETYFLVLSGLGGYGFWVLRGLALNAAEGADCRLVFYAAPLMIGAGALFSRRRPAGKALFGLLLGFAGCIMIVLGGATEAGVVAGPSKAGLLGLAAAACWAAFSVLVPRVLREARALPVVALVTGIGAACVLVTALSTGEHLFHIGIRQVVSCAAAGTLTIGLMAGFWLRCLADVSPVQAGVLWYLGAVTGTLWSILRGGEASWGWLCGGTVLIVFALYYSPSGSRPHQSATIGDLIRGSV